MFGSKLQERIVQDPGWNQWAAGEGVMPGSYALSVAASTQLLTVYGCVTRIANVMATMPVDHMTRTGGEQAKILPRAAWLDQPNPLISWESFIAQVMWSWLIDGNVFLIPIRNTFGRVVELYIIDPNRVKFQQLPGRPLVILIDGRPYTDELLHLPAFTRPGEVRGINPIENARVALSLGLAAQQYGAGFFDNSGVPAVVIKSKAPLNEDQKKELRNNWNRSHQGKAGGVGIISGEGVDLQQLTISPEQAQFLETRRFSAAEIAANLFHVPPDMVGSAIDGSSLTYQNLESRWTDFIRSACQPWMTRFEKAVSFNLLPRPQYIKFVPDVYLRADTETRYRTHGIGITHRFLTDDEAREKEDLPPLTDEQRKAMPPIVAPATAAPKKEAK
jgi:HK97 family phage portal protein